MRITVTSTSKTLGELLSPEDLGIMKAYYTTGGGAIFQNVGLNDVYIETGKAATITDSITITAASGARPILSVGFIRDMLTTQFKTNTGTSDLKMLF